MEKLKEEAEVPALTLNFVWNDKQSSLVKEAKTIAEKIRRKQQISANAHIGHQLLEKGSVLQIAGLSFCKGLKGLKGK